MPSISIYIINSIVTFVNERVLTKRTGYVPVCTSLYTIHIHKTKGNGGNNAEWTTMQTN